MNSRERVLAALFRQEPDRVPYCEIGIDRSIAQLLMGWGEPRSQGYNAVKRSHGDRICLLGNVDLNLLGLGTPEEVEQEVHGLIRDVGPGGGYIVTSGNSLAGYLKPENVLALSQAVQRYGHYPLTA